MEKTKLRLFINIHYLEIGGAEMALIGFLQSLDFSEVSVDLFLNDPRGEMMRFIPKEVNLIPSPKPYRMIEKPMAEAIRKGCLRVAAARLYARLKFRCYARKKQPKDGNAIFGYIGRYVTRVLPSLKKLGDYDIAISYLTPHDIVLKKVRAKRKICWIHTDYTSIDINREMELPIWNGYDKIVSISDDVTETFCRVFPELKEKIIKLENILSPGFIKERADEFTPVGMPNEAGVLNFLTIGRYSYQKNLDSIPKICRYLTENGINLKWYIIGYGDINEESKLKEAIREEKMDARVIILGKRENPYPFIKDCHFYIQPSRYEGKSITVKEAQILGKPVIIRNYPTAQSQIENGVDGFIGSFDTDDFARDVLKIISDSIAISKVMDNLKSGKLQDKVVLHDFFFAVSKMD